MITNNKPLELHDPRSVTQKQEQTQCCACLWRLIYSPSPKTQLEHKLDRFCPPIVPLVMGDRAEAARASALSLPELVAKWGKHSFFKRIPQDQLTSLIQLMLAKGQVRPWSEFFHPAANCEEILSNALHMYAGGLLDEERLAYAFLYAGIQGDPGFRHIDGNSSEWEQILIENLENFSPSRADRSSDGAVTHTPLPEAAPERIRRIKRQLLPEDCHFMIVSNASKTIIGSFFKSQKFLPFIEKSESPIIFSPKMFKFYLQEVFGSDAIMPTFVLGQSEVEKLSDIRSRVVSISTKWSPALKVHGSQEAQHYVMPFHDVYHVIVDSANPHRALFVHLASIAKALKAEYPESPSNRSHIIACQYLDQLRIRLLDRDFPDYAQHVKNNNNAIFWDSIAIAEIRAIWEWPEASAHVGPIICEVLKKIHTKWELEVKNPSPGKDVSSPFQLDHFQSFGRDLQMAYDYFVPYRATPHRATPLSKTRFDTRGISRAAIVSTVKHIQTYNQWLFPGD